MKLAKGTFQGLAESEVELFRTHLKGVSGIGVEIGCCDGYSSAVILDASDLHLISIDPFIQDSMEPSLIGSRDRYIENTEPWASRRRLHCAYSKDIGPSAQLDFLFIDGDHTYEGCLFDLKHWGIVLKQGGLLAMHDARMMRPGGAPFHPGPSRVAEERVFANPLEWEILGEAFSLVIARKK